MRGKIRFAMVTAITIVAWLFPAAVATAQTTDPIVGRWRLGDFEVTVSSQNDGFIGVVSGAPGNCVQACDQIWTITSKSGSIYSGTSTWVYEDCSPSGDGPTTWELQDSGSVLHEITTSPNDPSDIYTNDYTRGPVGSIEGRWRGTGEHLFDLIAVTGQPHSFETRAAEDWTLSNGCKVLTGDVTSRLTPLGGDRYDDAVLNYGPSASNPPGDRNDYCVREYRDPVVLRFVLVTGAATEENPSGEYLNLYADCFGCDPLETWPRVGSSSGDTTPPHITDVTDRPDPFTPNGDGHKDRVTIYFTLDENAIVTISIFSAKGTLKNRVRGGLAAGKRQIYWDGRTKKGKLCRSGKYTYQLKAVDPSGNRMTPPVTGKFKLVR